MFKFKIVEDKQLNKNIKYGERDKLNFLEENGTSFGSYETFTLWVTDPEEQNILGSLSLNKRELKHLQEEIRELIPNGTYLWEGSVLSFSYLQDLTYTLENFSHHFYHVLYEGIVAFGLQKDVGFVLVKLTAEAYLPTKEFGFWPYVMEFHPGAFPDNSFYGILPLKGKLYEKYKQNWENMAVGRRVGT